MSSQPLMNEKVLKALNEQIKHEFYSSLIYLEMASYMENIPLDGFGKWFRKQAQEENEHGMKIFNYIIDRNCHAEIPAIDKPPFKFKSIEQIFEMALEHEQKVTSLIHSLYELANKEKDYATAVFLQWYITEQVEEEKNAHDNIDIIRFNKDDRAGLLVLDQTFAKKAE